MIQMMIRVMKITNTLRMMAQVSNPSVVLVGAAEAMVGVVVTGAGTVVGAAAMKTQEGHPMQYSILRRHLLSS